jgi:hypothetical protein
MKIMNGKAMSCTNGKTTAILIEGTCQQRGMLFFGGIVAICIQRRVHNGATLCECTIETCKPPARERQRA